VYQRSRQHRRPDQPTSAFERLLVLLVLAAFIALVVWIVMSAGGGVINQG
jgi:hypothetical protein